MEKYADYNAYKQAILNLTNGVPVGGEHALPFFYAASLGEPILRVHVKDDGDGVLQITFPSGTVSLWDAGRSCCEHRYMTTDDELDSFVGAKLMGVDMVEVEDETEYGELHEQVFVKIETTAGTITCVTHNEHNGYYGGFSLRSIWESARG